MIEPRSTDTPISAIQAAINTGTTLLLSLYCSSGDTNFTHETEALASAITQYGNAFTDLIVGTSVGGEDLYRNSVATDGVGDTPANMNKYISQTRAVLTDASLNKLVGHVDTYGIWTNAASGGLVCPMLILWALMRTHTGKTQHLLMSSILSIQLSNKSRQQWDRNRSGSQKRAGLSLEQLRALRYQA